MKQFLFTCGMIVIYTLFLIHQNNNNLFLLHQEYLKHVADNSASSGALYYELEAFGQGLKVFDRNESIKAIEFHIQKGLKLDSDFNPLVNSYWQDKISYSVIFFDDANTIYPYMYRDEEHNFIKLITEPTVIVQINAGKPRFLIDFIKLENIVRSSGYEYIH